YIVPELNGAKPELVDNRALTYYKEAKDKLGIDGKPVILGPITYLQLSKGYEADEFSGLVDTFLPLYVQILQELQEAGATWVQRAVSGISSNVTEVVIAAAEKVYSTFAEAAPGIKIIIQTYFRKVFESDRNAALTVKGLGLDFVHGDALELLKTYGFPK